MTYAQHLALVTRPDLLEAECAIVRERRIRWAARARELAGYGRSGGSSADRRLVAGAMAALEAEVR